MLKSDDFTAKPRSRFQRHTRILMWKSYLQRQRRWRILLAETVFASLLFTLAVVIANPVFLTPLQAEPEPPLTTTDLLASLDHRNIVGYAPEIPPYRDIMTRAAELLNTSVIPGQSEFELNQNLYKSLNGSVYPIDTPVIWIIWKPRVGNMWRVSIRSTERARYQTSTEYTAYPNPHLRAGFLAVQLAISQAVLEYSSVSEPVFEVNLLAMPVSPLMQKDHVDRALSGILLCFTLALIPPVLETQALVVEETMSMWKRALRIRGVEYFSMYAGWMVYAYLTVLPICFLATITLLLIFRWIHLVYGLLVLLSYSTIMILTALLMAMFHNKVWIACLWNTLYTLLQTYLAVLLVHHEYDMMHGALTFVMHVLLPPVGLVHAMNEFALLQTGQDEDSQSTFSSLGIWLSVILFYFTLLMLLQRTIGHERAIGGQVSLKSIIFTKIEDVNQLHEIETPTGREREKLQEVDGLVAKAISFNNVSKSIMGVKVLNKVTLDIYRGEFSMLFAEKVQERILATMEDLLTGLSFADTGTINVLGHVLKPGENYITQPHMMGFYHSPAFLIEDLTIMEHFTLFNDICMWNESREYIITYGRARVNCLLQECHLKNVQNELVRNMDVFFRSQLCWALAYLMEPRIVIIPNLSDQHPRHIMVVKDKIMQYRTYVTLIKMCFSSQQLEYADRVFVFDSKVLAFGGTPAYMFFKYGREYRVRMTIRSEGSHDDQSISHLLERVTQAGASVRAHLGSMLILRLPVTPTEVVAALVKDLMENAPQYGMLSLHISVPDSQEVYMRAMMESRATIFDDSAATEKAKEALKRIAEPQKWTKRTANTIFCNFGDLRNIGWKHFTFHVHYKLYFLITLLSAVLAGFFIGLSLSTMLDASGRDDAAKKLLQGEILTMESTGKVTTLVLRADSTRTATSVANAYVLSEPNATMNDIKRLSYSAISATESLTEYLVTRAIDSPQLYVSLFAYGMDVKTLNNTLVIYALYSPLHRDIGAAARSLAKVYTALLRHYTDLLDASIEVTDDPLALDLTPWMRYASKPPLFLQFLLILSIAHITLIPSIESGLIRHMQSHAMNFSPARYWLTLYFCDLILCWMLVGVTTGVMILIMHLVAPPGHFVYGDLLVVPSMLILYGVACVPQAYLFSLSPRVALNTMTFIIINIVFGETTIIAKIFYGEVLSYTIWLMSLSPQFNIAYAFVKIKQIFLYNSECIIFKNQNLCSNKILHKCCQKCGVLQKCFSKRSYLSYKPGILGEMTAMITLAVLYMTMLLLLQYKVIQRFWKYFMSDLTDDEPLDSNIVLKPGVEKEKLDVTHKWEELNVKKKDKIDKFGEYLLAQNLTMKKMGMYMVHSVYIGLGKGETVGLSGLIRHGRLKLVEMLAGFRPPDRGFARCMSRWNLDTDPHKYARQISMSCEMHEPLPTWMKVSDGLEFLASLRGVPQQYIKEELRNIIDALEIQDQANMKICRIVQKTVRTRVHFAAAIIGAPPIIVLDECTTDQKATVRRSMYCLLHLLRKRGHGLFISSSSIEAHMPMTNRFAIMLDGTIADIDIADNFVERYSHKGYTVVVHLKDEVDVQAMFAKHFQNFNINDTSEVLVNVQILDDSLTWATLFEKMEDLKMTNKQVYSYIVTALSVNYIYSSIINSEKGNRIASDFVLGYRFRRKKTSKKIQPSKEKLASLLAFTQRYDIDKLKGLPWSVIFHR